MDDGRYDPMIRVQDVPVTTSHLTMFGLWKRVDSRLHTVGQSRETRPTTPCTLTALAVRANEQTMLYPSRLRQYTAMEIFFE